MSEHLIPRVTDRGFRHMPEVWDDRRGRLRLFESSAADEGHIWLAVDEPGAAQDHHLADQVGADRTRGVRHPGVTSSHVDGDTLRYLAG